jgi:hypothetical protein
MMPYKVIQISMENIKKVINYLKLYFQNILMKIIWDLKAMEYLFGKN